MTTQTSGTNSQQRLRIESVDTLLDDQLTGVIDEGGIPLLRGNVDDRWLAANGKLVGLVDRVAHTASSLGYETMFIGRSGKICEYDSTLQQPADLVDGDPETIDDLLKQAAQSVEPVFVLITLPEHLATGRSSSALRTLERLREFVEQSHPVPTGHRVVLIVRGEPKGFILKLPGVRSIECALPGYPERLALILALCNAPEEQRRLKLAPGLSPEIFAQSTAGLHNTDILGARRRSQRQAIDGTWVQQTKQARIPEIYQPTPTLSEPPSRAGMLPAQLRLVLKDRPAGMQPLLLAGPKHGQLDRICAALAEELKLPMIAVSLDRPESIQPACRVAATMAPSLLYVQRVTSRETAEQRAAVEQLLDLVDYSEAPVTIVGATNAPRLIHEELSSRFLILPILPESPDEQAKICADYARRRGWILDVVAAGRALQALDRALTRADLLSVVAATESVAASSGVLPINIGHFERALADLTGLLAHGGDKVGVLNAIARCNVIRYLPWNAAKELGEEIILPDYLSSNLDGTEVDLAKLMLELDALEDSVS